MTMTTAPTRDRSGRVLTVFGVLLAMAVSARGGDDLVVERRDPPFRLQLAPSWKGYRITERRLTGAGLASPVVFISVPIESADGSREYVRLLAVARCQEPCRVMAMSLPGMTMSVLHAGSAGRYLVAWRRVEACPAPLRGPLADRDAVMASFAVPGPGDDGRRHGHTFDDGFFFFFRMLFNR